MNKHPVFYHWILRLLIGLLFLNLVVLGIKDMVKRPRPTTILKDYSFPSQHAANAFFLVAYTSGFPVWATKKKDRKLKVAIMVGLYLLAGLVGYSRVYFRVHYWSDVVAGGIIGVILALYSYRLWQ